MRRGRGVFGVTVGLAVMPLVLLACGAVYGVDDGNAVVPVPGPDDASTDAGDAGGGDASASPPGDAEVDARVDQDAPPVCGVHEGPSMVSMGSYCIDSTEVSLAQYNKFLATNPPVTQYQPQTPDCDFNVSYAANVFRVGADLPVHVNWCSAYAYCAWAGKRLCGKIGGGAVVGTEASDPLKSQWMQACSQGGTSTYPYGNAYSATACPNAQTPDGGGGKSANVGTNAMCRGSQAPFDSVFDMAANVEEWEDNCSGALCPTRGGSAELNAVYTACADLSAQRYRNTDVGEIGFRCCSK